MSDLTQEIVLAAEAGDLEKVKAALKKGASPDAMGPNSGALHCAAFNGHKTIVAALLKAGSNPNIKDNQGFYPLHLAASKGHTAICNALIKGGAALENITEKGGTALHVAAASNFGKVVAALLKAGADIETRDIYGYTALNSAASLGNHAIVKNLIKAGAKADTADDDNDTALIKAIRNMYNCRVDGWSSVGTNGGRDVRYSVDKGCFRYDRNYVANSGKLGDILTLKDQRYCAAQAWGPQGHIKYLDALDTVKTLVKEGVDVHAINSGGQTALSIACHSGEAKIIELLHKKGASFDVKDVGGTTPLHRVAGSGRLDGLEMYFKLNPKADVNVLDDNGWTPIFYLADIGGHLKMAELLLSKGADTSIKSTGALGNDMPAGISASDVALHWKDKKMADALK